MVCDESVYPDSIVAEAIDVAQKRINTGRRVVLAGGIAQERTITVRGVEVAGCVGSECKSAVGRVAFASRIT